MEQRLKATLIRQKTMLHVVDVEVTVNGARHFQKSWSVTVPRKLN